QTFFLAIADLAHRNVNLEHAAASLENLMQAVLFVMLMAVALLAGYLPEWTILHVHPATIVLFSVYALGVRLVQRARHAPLWKPVHTPHTVPDAPDAKVVRSADRRAVWMRFAVYGAIVGLCGFVVG